MPLTANQQRIWGEARAAGFDEEGARVAVAIAQAEGLDATGPGDAGHSAGAFQFYFGMGGPGGVGDVWARALGLSWQAARGVLRAARFAADGGWRGGPRGGAIRAGRALGLGGADLARWAGQAAERPKEGNEESYATQYRAIWGDPPALPVDTPGSPPPG